MACIFEDFLVFFFLNLDFSNSKILKLLKNKKGTEFMVDFFFPPTV